MEAYDGPQIVGMDLHRRRSVLTAPEHMTDGAPAVFVPFKSGYDPGDPASASRTH